MPPSPPDPHRRPEGAPAETALLGRWRLLRAHYALDFAPDAGMEFRHGGELVYSFAVGAGRTEMLLVYAVRGDHLHTLSPAAAHSADVRFRIGAGDVLVLDFGGVEACFVREK